MDIVDIYKAFRSNLWHSDTFGAINTPKKWRPHGDSNPGYRRERANFVVVFIALFVVLWTSCGQIAHATDHTTIDIGSVYHHAVGDGMWYQNSHRNERQNSGVSFGLGFNRQLSSRWSSAVSVRYLGSGEWYAEWEPDDTYGVADKDHSVVGRGTSTWRMAGVGFDADYRATSWLSVGAGAFYFHGYWKTEHYTTGSDERHFWRARAFELSPSVKAALHLTREYTVTATHYFDLRTSGQPGIESGTSIVLTRKF